MRTVQRAERGESLDAASLSVMAEALGSEVSEILVPAEPKTEELLFLPRVATAAQLREIAGCHAQLLMNDDPLDDGERSVVGMLLDSLEDWNMIWDDLSPSAQLEAAASLLEVVRALDATGLRAFAVVGEKDVEIRKGASDRWTVAHVVITRSDNPSVVSKPGSPEETAVFAAFPIKPSLQLDGL